MLTMWCYPSWHGMQDLITILSECSKYLDIAYNVRKTKCMVVNPVSVDKWVCRLDHSHVSVLMDKQLSL